TRVIREQHFHRHIERVWRVRIGIDCCAVWPGHFGRCGRDRNDSRRARCGLAVAGDAKDRRAGSDPALSLEFRVYAVERLPHSAPPKGGTPSIFAPCATYGQNEPCSEIVP